MDELNIQIDELAVGPDADLLGQIRAAAGDGLGPVASRRVAEQISTGIEAAIGRRPLLDSRSAAVG